MRKKDKTVNFFWTSYSDLMTSLFFIMLVLFILSIFLMRSRMVANERQIAKIKEIENAVSNIDKYFFTYSSEFKKHILNTRVEFSVGSSDIQDIPSATLTELYDAGNAIVKFINTTTEKYSDSDIRYLLVIEGQASKDNYQYNYELSYKRALSLYQYWIDSGVNFNTEKCEIIIAGSGVKGVPREIVESNNQRFLINILPKPGVIDLSN